MYRMSQRSSPVRQQSEENLDAPPVLFTMTSEQMVEFAQLIASSVAQIHQGQPVQNNRSTPNDRPRNHSEHHYREPPRRGNRHSRSYHPRHRRQNPYQPPTRESSPLWVQPLASIPPLPTQPRDTSGPVCFRYRQSGHYVRNCPQPDRRPQKRASEPLCFRCKEPGHQVRNCTQPDTRRQREDYPQNQACGGRRRNVNLRGEPAPVNDNASTTPSAQSNMEGTFDP
jgi:hypothetical protein